MTTNQLNVILMTAKLGSISAAAKALGLSQPNASNCIKTVEEEVGYEIFERGKNGTKQTPNGILFLEHAKRIIEESQRILLIRSENEFHRLRVGVTHFSRAYNAFVSFCNAFSKDNPTNDNVDFQCYGVNIQNGFHLLSSGDIDVYVNLNFNEDEPRIKNTAKELHLEKIMIGKIQGELTFRKGHPAVEKLTDVPNAQYSEVLKEYPYIYYSALQEAGSSYFTYNVDYIPCSTRILVDNAETRLKLVASSNAFCSGCRLKEEIKQRNGVVSLPIKDLFFNVNCFVKKEKSKDSDIRKYIEYLQQDLEIE